MSAHKAKGSGLEWFVRRGAAVRGPFTSMRVRHFVLEGKLGLDDEVSPDREEWQRLGDVAEVTPLQMRDEDGETALAGGARGGDRPRALRAMAVALVVVGGLTLAVYYAGSGESAKERDCAAKPVPGLFLEGCGLAGVEWVEASLADARMANVTLTGARLSQADLSGADMRYAELTGADLSYARLGGASLLGATLRLADLTNADLSGADLSFADLSSARLGGARLDGARLDGTIWVDGRPCEAGNCPR